MKVLLLMAKSNNNQCQDYLKEIDGFPLIKYNIDSISFTDDIICLIRKQDQENYFLSNMINVINSKCKVIEIPGETKGALCTALYAIDNIDDSELVILDGDVLITKDKQLIIEKFRSQNLDIGIVCMEALNLKYSSVLTDNNGYVIQISEKKPISNQALSGMTWFKNGLDFINAAMQAIKKDQAVNNSYYTSAAINEAILNGKKVKTSIISANEFILGGSKC